MIPAEDPVLDQVDRTILGVVSGNGRISVRDLADRINLSTSATSERLRRLEASGAIVGYRAVLSPAVLARPVDAVVGVRARPDVDRAEVEAWLCGQQSIVEAVHLTGPHDYLLRLRCVSTGELDVVLMAMKSHGGIAVTETSVVLRSLPVSPEGP